MEIIQLSARASAMPRITKCPGSMMLDSTGNTGDASRLGTSFHTLAAQIVSGQLSASTPEIRQLIKEAAKRDEVDADELSMLFWGGIALWERFAHLFNSPATEASMAIVLDVDDDDEALITGTADIVQIYDEGRIVIADWKTGRVESDYLAQLKTYALMALDKYEMYSVAGTPRVSEIQVAIFWVRDREAVVETFTPEEIREFQMSLSTVLSEAKAGVLRTGEHCKYCPVTRCPALRERALVFSPENVIEINADTIPQIWGFAKAVAKQAENVLEAVAQHVRNNGPVPLGDGTFLGFKETQKETIQATPEAWEHIKSQLGEEVALGAVTIGKTKFQDAIKATAPKGQGAKAANAAMEALRELGATKTSVSESLTPLKELKK